MAEKIDEFKKEFARIEKELQKGSEVSRKVQQWTGQSSGITKEACKEIGRRVQELKDKGVAGATIKDFENDAEVKEQLKYIDTYLVRTQNELRELATARDGFIAKAVSDFWDLKKELEAEIAKRKKKQQGIVKIDSKSLPEMEKFLGDLNKFKDSKEFLGMAGMVVEDFADYKRDIDTWLNDALSKTKDLQLSADREEMAERALDMRVLKKNVSQAKTLNEEIKKHCADAIEAKNKGDAPGAKAALTEGAKCFKPLNEMAKIYKLASEDQWIKARVAESKDKSTIQQAMVAIAALHKSAGDELKKAL